MRIIFEGIDGVGKTKQATLLANLFKNNQEFSTSIKEFIYPCREFSVFLKRSKISKLHEFLIQLYMVAGELSVHDKYKYAICDRYLFSTYAYQCNIVLPDDYIQNKTLCYRYNEELFYDMVESLAKENDSALKGVFLGLILGTKDITKHDAVDIVTIFDTVIKTFLSSGDIIFYMKSQKMLDDPNYFIGKIDSKKEDRYHDQKVYSRLKLHEGFMKAIEIYRDKIHVDSVIEIDADRPVDEIHSEITSKIKNKLPFLW